MNFIEITLQSLKPKFAKSADTQFRSVEKELEKLKRDYSVNDFSKVITVTVIDKVDAILLSERLGLEDVKYSENGAITTIQIKPVEKLGRPKNIVRVSWFDKDMTLRQVTKFTLKELQKTHLLKSQILKAKILTKTQLEKYIADGTLQVVNHGTKIFIDRESVLKLMK